MFLFKCFLLQKWFQIKSDPELESMINDRISFKSFLKLPIDYPSPDHSTFSRFRKRLSREAMIKINSEFLALNNIKDGIMRKDNINAKLTAFEIKRNKSISKFRYIETFAR